MNKNRRRRLANTYINNQSDRFAHRYLDLKITSNNFYEKEVMRRPQRTNDAMMKIRKM